MPLPPTLPELTSLDLFVSVVQLGSLSKAARAHGISQPSASERIRNLERQLGLVLLLRSRTGSLPSPEGLLVAEWAASVLAAADELLVGAAALRPSAKSRLVVAASYTIAEHLLPRWLGPIQVQFPATSVELEVANSAAVLERVRGGAAQVGFVESPDRATGLASREIAVDELVVVVAPAHPWASRRKPLSIDELAETQLVLREEGSGTRDALHAALMQAGFQPAVPLLELGSTASVKSAVVAAVGPAALSQLAVAAEVSAGRLVTVEVDGLDLRRSLRAVWRRTGSLPPSAAALVAHAARTSRL